MNDSLPPNESPAPAETTPAASPTPPLAKPRQEAWRNPWIGVAVVALGLAGWQWVETRIKLSDTQQELAKRLADADSLSKETRGVAKQSQEEVGRHHGPLRRAQVQEVGHGLGAEEALEGTAQGESGAHAMPVRSRGRMRSSRGATRASIAAARWGTWKRVSTHQPWGSSRGMA